MISKRAWVVGAAALLLAAGGASPASAQQPVSGQWQCQHANRSATDNAFENYIYEFTLGLKGDGTFSAQGNYIAQTNGFAVPFTAAGKWEQEQAGLVVNGTEQRQDGTAGQFVLVFSLVGDRAISNRFESANGSLLSYCQR